MIRLLVVDDHDLVRVGLSHIIDGDPGIRIVGEAANGKDAIRLNRELKPDVILLDVSMPGLSGFEVTRRIKQCSPAVHVIILTVHADAPYPARLLDAGASGYLTKACRSEELIRAIKTVFAGERFVGSDIAQQLALSLLPGEEGSPFNLLSAREMEVALLLTQGQAMTEIAETLRLSPKTVATYKYRIHDKLSVSNEVELVRLALRYGLMDVQAEAQSRS